MRDDAAAMAGALSSPLGLSMAISSLTLPLAILILRFHVVEHRVDFAHFVDGVDFRADQTFQARAHHRFQVGVHARMADGVDAHVAGRRAGRFFAAQGLARYSCARSPFHWARRRLRYPA